MNADESGTLCGAAPYLLSNHVHLCRTQDHVVLLDLRRNKYLAVGEASCDVMTQLVRGWPASREGDAAEVSPAKAGGDALARKMRSQGMLTTDLRHGRSIEPIRVSVAAESLVDEDATSKLTLSLRDVGSFLASSVRALIALRTGRLDWIVRNAINRKTRLTKHEASQTMANVRRAVRKYEYLRPLVFASRDACLFDSLALFYFLTNNGLIATWVIGVRTRPFGAHSWIQHDGVIFNDIAEHARSFTPILAV